MRAQVGQPQRTRVGDELSQQTLALGEMAHLRARRLVDAHVEEPGQAAVRAEHTERPVPGLNQVDGGLDQASQGGVELQPGADGEEGIQQALHAVAGGHDLGQPVLHLAEELVEPQAGRQIGNRRLGIRVCRHRLSPRPVAEPHHAGPSRGPVRAFRP